MSERKIRTIPASINRFTATPLTEQRKRRVAGYARVSTDKEDQVTSYEAQVDYYTKYIQSREDWTFIGVFTDEGITATNTKKRDGFNKMVALALSGGIDLIVTKSVSRFARNTVDSLSTIRKLKDAGCEVYFEKENIFTFDSKGELLITLMSSLAQEESRSISENCVWGQRKRFADGKVCVPYKRFLGYDRHESGDGLAVNEEQAVIVRRIYKMFLDGATPHIIANTLTDEGIPSPGGKEKWYARTVQSILTNEKYKGDALLQKSYTVDFLSKRKKMNEGEVPQWYVENSHEGIVSDEVFAMVQLEIERRKSGTNRHSGVGIFASKIKCGTCGGWFGSKLWHSNSKYKRTIYQCNQKFKNEEKCDTPHLYEEQIKAAFVTAVNKLLADKDSIIADFQEFKSVLFDTTALDKEQSELQSELAVAAELIQKCIAENARVALDQAEYQKRYDALSERYDKAKARLAEVEELLRQTKSRKEMFESFMKRLGRQDGLLTEFSEGLWTALLDFATVYKDGKITFTFKNGMTFEG